MGLLSLGVALVVAASVLFATTLRVRGRADFLPASLVLAAAMVVGEEILLSLVHELTREALLAAQLLWTAAAFGLWQRQGRPRPPSFRPPSAGTVVHAVRRHRPLSILLVVVALALGLQATMATAVAPNEYDTLGYHLPRAAFWLQYHSALQYHPEAFDDPEQVKPPNAELLIAWTMALSRSDTFAQLAQWLAAIGLPHAAFVAGLSALYPVTLPESYTGQNDIVLAFFLDGHGRVRGQRHA